MELEQHIKNLKEYCELGKKIIQGNSDFDIFCKNHIADIEAVLKALAGNEKVINKMAKDIIFMGTNPDLKPEELIESYYKYLQYLDNLKAGGADAKET